MTLSNVHLHSVRSYAVSQNLSFILNDDICVDIKLAVVEELDVIVSLERGRT